MLSFNRMLEDEGFALPDVRMLRHQDTRATRGRTPLKLWRMGDDVFDSYQNIQNPHNATRLSVPYWASFVGTPSGGTLFVGMFAAEYTGLNEEPRVSPHDDSVSSPGSVGTFRLQKLDALSEYIGRLGIQWGDGARAWVQRADKQIKYIDFIEKSAEPPTFPGFRNLIIPLSEVLNMPTSWEDALRSTRGIYLLTCPKTREQYVGAATGENGFLGRWLDYVVTGTGGNLGLRSREPSDYQVCILETAGSAATIDEVLAMEDLWKRKLRSREMGLNRN